MSWRDHARPIIARVLQETAGQDESAIREALKAAYPYGQRKYHPYQIWLDEIHRQRGEKTPAVAGNRTNKASKPADPRQGSMFEETAHHDV